MKKEFKIFVKVLQINFIACINVKLPKIQISKSIQSSGFLKKRLEPLIKARLSLPKNELVLLAESAFIPLDLKAAASERNGGHSEEQCWIQKGNICNFR